MPPNTQQNKPLLEPIPRCLPTRPEDSTLLEQMYASFFQPPSHGLGQGDNVKLEQPLSYGCLSLEQQRYYIQWRQLQDPYKLPQATDLSYLLLRGQELIAYPYFRSEVTVLECYLSPEQKRENLQNNYKDFLHLLRLSIKSKKKDPLKERLQLWAVDFALLHELDLDPLLPFLDNLPCPSPQVDILLTHCFAQTPPFFPVTLFTSLFFNRFESRLQESGHLIPPNLIEEATGKILSHINRYYKSILKKDLFQLHKRPYSQENKSFLLFPQMNFTSSYEAFSYAPPYSGNPPFLESLFQLLREVEDYFRGLLEIQRSTHSYLRSTLKNNPLPDFIQEEVRWFLHQNYSHLNPKERTLDFLSPILSPSGRNYALYDTLPEVSPTEPSFTVSSLTFRDVQAGEPEPWEVLKQRLTPREISFLSLAFYYTEHLQEFAHSFAQEQQVELRAFLNNIQLKFMDVLGGSPVFYIYGHFTLNERYQSQILTHLPPTDELSVGFQERFPFSLRYNPWLPVHKHKPRHRHRILRQGEKRKRFSPFAVWMNLVDPRFLETLTHLLQQQNYPFYKIKNLVFYAQQSKQKQHKKHKSIRNLGRTPTVRSHS